MIKVVDNFLPKNEFVKIRDVICAKDFPFFYNGFVTDENKPSDDNYILHIYFLLETHQTVVTFIYGSIF